MSGPEARRNFFRQLTAEAKSLVDEGCGIPQLQLEDLHELPEHKLRQVVPAVLPDIQLAYRDGNVAATTAGGRSLVLFAANSDDLQLFSRFDGSCSLGNIAEQLAAGSAAQERLIFERMANLFLRLVDERICAPTNPIY